MELFEYILQNCFEKLKDIFWIEDTACIFCEDDTNKDDAKHQEYHDTKKRKIQMYAKYKDKWM